MTATALLFIIAVSAGPRALAEPGFSGSGEAPGAAADPGSPGNRAKKGTPVPGFDESPAPAPAMPRTRKGGKKRRPVPGFDADDSAAPAEKARPSEPPHVPAQAPPQGPARPDPPAEPARSGLPARSAPGVFPVYEEGGRWILVDPSGGPVGKGKRFLVVGGEGAGVFYSAQSTRTMSAGCENHRPVPTRVWWLSAKTAAAFDKIGRPAFALPLKPAASPDLSRARVTPLKNEAGEKLYGKFDAAIRAKAVSEILSGAFQAAPDDEEARALARRPNPKALQVKIDFVSRLRVQGLSDPFVLVEGTQAGKTFRRCLRLFDGAEPVGDCAPMPHSLMAETRQLAFAAYYEPGGDSPIVFAATAEAPVWGHERWAFRATKSGLSPFLREALDPRCRESY